MPLQHLRSSTLDKRPTPASMSDGQLAINTNTTSPGLFFKDSNGDLVKAGPVHIGATAPNVSPAVGGQAGNSKGEFWLDTTGGGYVLKVYDGTAWRTQDGSYVNVTGDTMTGNLTLDASSLIFDTGTFNTTVSATTATAARTITIPNITGTLVTTGDTGSVTNTMLAGSIADTKLSTISTAGKVSNSATTATNANTASAIVARDASGNFAAGAATLTSVALLGATSGTLTLTPPAVAGTTSIAFPATAGTVVTTGDTGTVTNTMLAGSIADSKLSTISTAGKVSNSATTATNLNTASAIVARDASGNFSAGTITAALTGNASTASTLQTARNIQGVSFNGSADITVVTAGTGISVTGTAVANTGVLSVNGSTGAVTNIAAINTAQSFSAAQRGTVSAQGSVTGTVTLDFAVANNFSMTLPAGGAVTLANPLNLTAGQSGAIVITQNATTAATVAYGANWKFSGGTPTMSTGLSSVSTLVYYVESATRITAQLLTNVA